MLRLSSGKKPEGDSEGSGQSCADHGVAGFRARGGEAHSEASSSSKRTCNGA